MPSTRTVLTGDLVASTTLEQHELARAFDGMLDAVAQIETWLQAPVHFTRNRGDGWQIVLPAPLPGLREALALRAGLRAGGKRLETRIALATGEADLPEGGNLNRASGTAFTAAGRLLDTLDGPAFDHADGGAVSATVVLAGEISAGWTPAQARAVLPMLSPTPPTQTQVADQLSITRQAVRQALIGASLPALSLALSRLEAQCSPTP